MKRIVLALILISPFSFADWGDVYYCQMTTLSQTTLEGERADYKLEKFQFKLDKTKNAMVFGQEGFFSDQEYELREGNTWASIESWYADSEYAAVFFEKGKFLSSYTGPSGVMAFSADCDKF